MNLKKQTSLTTAGSHFAKADLRYLKPLDTNSPATGYQSVRHFCDSIVSITLPGWRRRHTRPVVPAEWGLVRWPSTGTTRARATSVTALIIGVPAHLGSCWLHEGADRRPCSYRQDTWTDSLGFGHAAGGAVRGASRIWYWG